MEEEENPIPPENEGRSALSGLFQSQTRWSLTLARAGKFISIATILYLAYLLLEARNNQLQMGVIFLVVTAFMILVWNSYQSLLRSGKDLKMLESKGEESNLLNYTGNIFRYFLFFNIILIISLLGILYTFFILL